MKTKKEVTDTITLNKAQYWIRKNSDGSMHVQIFHYNGVEKRINSLGTHYVFDKEGYDKFVVDYFKTFKIKNKDISKVSHECKCGLKPGDHIDFLNWRPKKEILIIKKNGNVIYVKPGKLLLKMGIYTKEQIDDLTILDQGDKK